MPHSERLARLHNSCRRFVIDIIVNNPEIESVARLEHSVECEGCEGRCLPFFTVKSAVLIKILYLNAHACQFDSQAPISGKFSTAFEVRLTILSKRPHEFSAHSPVGLVRITCATRRLYFAQIGYLEAHAMLPSSTSQRLRKVSCGDTK